MTSLMNRKTVRVLTDVEWVVVGPFVQRAVDAAAELRRAQASEQAARFAEQLARSTVSAMIVLLVGEDAPDVRLDPEKRELYRLLNPEAP